MLRIRQSAVVCSGLSLLLAGIVWAGPQGETDTETKQAGVAAYVGGKAITMQDLDAKALATNMELAQSIYKARTDALDQMIADQLLKDAAQKLGVSTDTVLANKIAEKTKPVTDEELNAFYDANKARMRGQTLDNVAGQIRQYLAAQRTAEARSEVLEEIKKGADVRVLLEPPRIEVVIAENDPVRCPSDAEVTIVEYSDFQ